MNSTVFHLLLALRQGPQQASDVLDRVGELADGQPSLAAFYRVLKGALDDQWVEVVGSDSDGPGRPRQIYALTQAGAGAIEKEARRMQALAELALGRGA